MMTKVRYTFKAFTLVEILVSLVILTTLITFGMVSLSSLKSKKDLQAESEDVKEDIYLMQSRSVTNLRTQRMNILSNSSYSLEEDTTGAGNWTIVVPSRSFRPNIYFYGYTGKETKLWYETSGLPNFNNVSSSPFFSLIYSSTSEKKDFNIDSSGVVQIVAN